MHRLNYSFNSLTVKIDINVTKNKFPILQKTKYLRHKRGL
jgi:hypothetical protein